LHQFTFPPTVNEGPLFSTSLPTFIVYVFDFNHSDRCEVISHFGFYLHFPGDEWCWASFHVSVCHLYVFFGEMSFLVLCSFLIGLFVFWVLNCISSLYILDTNPLLDMSFANIFSHSVDYLLVFLIVFLLSRSFLFDVAPVVYFYFCFLCFRGPI